MEQGKLEAAPLGQEFSLDTKGIAFQNPKLDSYEVSTPIYGAAEKPLYVSVDSGTDWGVILIGVASLLASVVIGVLTYTVQRNQIRANASNLRHQWIIELRAAASAFLQLASRVANNRCKVKDYPDSLQSDEEYGRLLELQIKIGLMMTGSDEACSDIIDGSEQVIVSLKDVEYEGKDERREVFKKMYDLENAFRSRLGEAWKDIKVDLGMMAREKS